MKEVRFVNFVLRKNKENRTENRSHRYYIFLMSIIFINGPLSTFCDMRKYVSTCYT